jgi:DNA invertase Pin-like site-specific DNA recombinase
MLWRHPQPLVTKLTERGVAVHFHKKSLTFSGDANPMQILQLQMMGAFAQFERSLIRERQREGISAAKARGQKLGAPAKITNVDEIRRRRVAGESVIAIAKDYGVIRQSIYNALKTA